jgi:hypothetical protein
MSDVMPGRHDKLAHGCAVARNAECLVWGTVMCVTTQSRAPADVLATVAVWVRQWGVKLCTSCESK